VISGVLERVFRVSDTVAVVDDSSTDATSKKVLVYSAILNRHPINWAGSQPANGFNFCMHLTCGFCCRFDADRQNDSVEIKRLIT